LRLEVKGLPFDSIPGRVGCFTRLLADGGTPVPIPHGSGRHWRVPREFSPGNLSVGSGCVRGVRESCGPNGNGIGSWVGEGDRVAGMGMGSGKGGRDMGKGRGAGLARGASFSRLLRGYRLHEVDSRARSFETPGPEVDSSG